MSIQPPAIFGGYCKCPPFEERTARTYFYEGKVETHIQEAGSKPAMICEPPSVQGMPWRRFCAGVANHADPRSRSRKMSVRLDDSGPPLWKTKR